MNLLNICGNALFIYVFNWGVAGAAWSTTISRFLGMLLLFVIISIKITKFISICAKNSS